MFIKYYRCDNPSWFLDCEVDANCHDINSSTAMMWACVKGHEEAAVALFHWNSASLKIRNKQGLSPLDLAQENGHTHLYDRLLTLQQDLSYNDSLISGDCFSTAGTVENSLAFPILTKSHDVPFSDSKTTIPCTSDCDLFKSPAPVLTKNKGPLGTLHIEIPSNPTPTFNSDKENLLIRRQSDQTLRAGIKSKRKLNKRFSVDLPSHSDDNRSSRAGSCDRPIREANSEPHLPMTALDALTRGENPMLSSRAHNVSSPDSLITALQDSRLAHLHQERMMGRIDQHDLVKMDTDDVPSSDNGSPLIDVEKLSSDEEPSDQRAMSDRQSVNGSEEAKQQMVTLAKQIIAAIPERIKYSPSRGDDFIDTTRERSSSYSSIPSQPSPHASSYGEDSGISTPMGDSFAFEEYRYPDINTPASSMSPESTCLPSPYSPYSFTLDSPPPTTAEFTEYFNAPATYMEKDFSQLTLSDQEQRRLYEAAKVIQKTYRQYRDKQQLQQQQQKEIYAAILIQKYYRRYKQVKYYRRYKQVKYTAILIQKYYRRYKQVIYAAILIQKYYRRYKQVIYTAILIQKYYRRYKQVIYTAILTQKYYRRYKQYAYYKKMTQAAVLIQSQFRSYYAQKRFKKSRDAAVVIQNQYRTYKEHERLKKGGNKSVIIQQRYRSHYQRKNMKGQSSGGHVVQIVPESAER
ncbi:hypothetical protein FSP39_001118 [Pinctada imbricata]|uniref:Uncharacterized protein n=1 Tax=Pinctada imbricata TaxID=66713 RepID=A0AA88YFJ7_PINIB|nr:hypothetical protein FSP39_001118 [Pinctada imbricata]